MKEKMIQTKGPLSLVTFALFSWSAFAENPVSHIQSVLRASEDFKSIQVELKNTNGWDIYCPKLKIKAQVRDPEQYTQVGEAQIVLDEVYLNKFTEERSRFYDVVGRYEIKRFEKQYPAAIYSELSFDAQTSHCVFSNFELYATKSTRSKEEEHALQSIYQVLNWWDPALIESKMSRIKRMNLSSRNLETLKPLEFFYGLKDLSVAYNLVSNLKPISALVNLKQFDISGTQVTSLRYLKARAGVLKVRANGTPLKDPSELGWYQ